MGGDGRRLGADEPPDGSPGLNVCVTLRRREKNLEFLFMVLFIWSPQQCDKIYSSSKNSPFT